MKPRTPLIVLGGDRTLSVMLSLFGDQYPLSGYKGADIRVMGRSLVEVVLDRARDSECFAPIYLAGPERVYRQLRGPATLVDTDGSFSQNIQRALETVCCHHLSSLVAFMTCDVVLEVATVQRLIALYAESSPCDLWAPMVRIQQEFRPLGASAWKPRYRIVPQAGEPPVEALPGHLVVVDPDALSLDLAYKDLHLALELGDELGVPLSQGAATHNLQRLARGMGFGPDDSTSVLRVYERMLGRKVKP
jgi:hypothetical protein